MDELQVIRHGDVDVVDSRDVARMVERNHNELLKSIRSYCEYLGQGDFAQSDFFIPFTYINSQNKEQPCYLLTKKGCDMVANKMTGEKGVLFTAAYVTAFERMREHIESGQPLPGGVDLVKQTLADAKLRNAKSREAAMWLKIADKVNLPEYQQICAHYASSVLAGREVLPLSEVTERTYTAKEVGEMLGGISAAMVGRLANRNGLKTPEYGKQVWDKSPYSSKEVPAWRYNERAVELLKKIVKTNNS